MARASIDVVSIERLLSEVWVGVIVAPASVYQAVSQLRKLLGDTDAEPSYIATVPRKGYRLVAPVQPLEPPRQSAQHVESPVVPLPQVASRRLAPKLAIAGLGIIGLASLAVFSGRLFLATDESADSIAVLPFADLSAIIFGECRGECGQPAQLRDRNTATVNIGLRVLRRDSAQVLQSAPAGPADNRPGRVARGA